MAVKQRVIWMDDTDWAHLHLVASQVGLNPSQYIRQVMRRPENTKTLGKETEDLHQYSKALTQRRNLNEMTAISVEHEDKVMAGRATTEKDLHPTAGMSQAQRDEVLRKLTSKKR